MQEKDIIFDNCSIYAPDNVLLSRASRKRINWYLKHDLAELISPDTIRLKFEPSGREGIDDPFIMTAKPNRCVVCGQEERLTRHHVIPQCIICYFPDRFKKHNSHDILGMCGPCHRLYEDQSEFKRQELAAKLGISVHGKNHQLLVERRQLQGMAITLARHGPKLPLHRSAYLRAELEAVYGPLTDEDLKKIARKTDDELRTEVGFVNFGDVLLDSIKDFNEFGAQWRQHFVQTMQPRYMPDHWKINKIKAL